MFIYDYHREFLLSKCQRRGSSLEGKKIFYETFEVDLDSEEPSKSSLGLIVDPKTFVVQTIESDSVVGLWNRDNQAKQLRVGDSLLVINDICVSDDPDKAKDKLEMPGTIKLTGLRTSIQGESQSHDLERADPVLHVGVDYDAVVPCLLLATPRQGWVKESPSQKPEEV